MDSLIERTLYQRRNGASRQATIQVLLRDGDNDPIAAVCNAIVVGGVALHREIVDGCANGNRWHLTHLASGMTIGAPVQSCCAARRALRVLSALPFLLKPVTQLTKREWATLRTVARAHGLIA